MTTIPKHQRWQAAKAWLSEPIHIPGILDIISEYHDGIEGYRVELPDMLTNPVICALPNGLLACAQTSGLIGIYRNGKLLRTIGSPGDSSPMLGLAGLPNGAIASATRGITRVWDANEVKRELAIQNSEKLVALSDGKLAVASARSVSIWDLDTGIPVYSVNLCGYVTHLVALPGARLAIASWVYDTVGWDHHVSIWCEGQIIKTIINPSYIIMLTEFNGKLAVGCEGYVHVWDELFERSSEFGCAEALLWRDHSVCLSPNGLVSSYVSGKFRTWDLYTGKLLQILPYIGKVYESMWHADYLLASTSDGVSLWF